MNFCEYCGKQIRTNEDKDIYNTCDGILTLGRDPYQSEVNENYEKTWDCEGNRYESAMDIQ